MIYDKSIGKLIGTFAICLLLSCSTNRLANSSEANFVIAFGSCSDEDKAQILWPDILDENPDVWIWLGDNIYGDSDDINVLRSKYNKQKSNGNYQKLISESMILATWDDHDYGLNDGGKNFSAKAESQIAFCDFLDLPSNDPLRSQKGIYYSKDLQTSVGQIKFIMLDSRYFRDDIIKEDGAYIQNQDGTLLGEEQWAWFANELNQSTADINIIASSIQAVPEQHQWEKWSNFPNERKRLFELIKASAVSNPIIISGDRHIGEISKLNYQGVDIYDITSSSLTHGWSEHRDEENIHRIGDIVYKENYGIIKIDADGSSKSIIVQLKSFGANVEEEINISN